MTTHPRSLCRFLTLLLMTLGVHPALGADDPFRVDSKPPTGGLVTRTSDSPPTDILGSEMLRALSGVLGELETRDFIPLRRALGKPIESPTLGEPFAVVHMTRSGSDPVLVGFSMLDDGTYAVQALNDPNATVFSMDPATLGAPISPPAPEPRLPASDSEDELRFELAKPYTASPITLDTKTRRSRFRANYPDLTREIGNETMQVRLPKGFDPDAPSGILIWICPGDDGRPPRIFESICDELGLICVGIDHNGNTRPLTDRLQNHLDSIETLASRYRIDRERVYLTGMSGGGRCSGILQCSFPEIFAGAVPIVGLDSYHNAPTGEGKKYWPARIGKPSPRWFSLLKERRIAAITGSVDFNEPEMQIRQDLMTKDGLQVRLDVIEGMGHAMPTSEQFAEALRWVDEPRRDAMAEALARAQEQLDATRDADPGDPKVRESLIGITTIAPWTQPAWEAAELLGFRRP
ncbi:MAG: hypothetical protein KC996_10090 [Phycisphaerales bacterium]|nr:hypothetical protein [Phycisphaerales bacterium]